MIPAKTRIALGEPGGQLQHGAGAPVAVLIRYGVSGVDHFCPFQAGFVAVFEDKQASRNPVPEDLFQRPADPARGFAGPQDEDAIVLGEIQVEITNAQMVAGAMQHSVNGCVRVGGRQGSLNDFNRKPAQARIPVGSQLFPVEDIAPDGQVVPRGPQTGR